MVDPAILMRMFLLTVDGTNGLNALLAPRSGTGSIYTGDLPDGIDPVADGPAIVVAARGGMSNPDLAAITRTRMQVTIWDAVNQYKRASQVYAALYDWCHLKDNINFAGVGFFMSCFEVVPPQSLTDPDTGWPTIQAFYELMAHS